MKSPPHRLRDINGLSRRFVLGGNEKTNQLSILAWRNEAPCKYAGIRLQNYEAFQLLGRENTQRLI